MKDSSTYSLAVRFGHFISIILLFLVGTTGIRPAWREGSFFSRGIGNVVNSIALTACIRGLHVIYGVVLVAIVFFYSVYLLLSGEVPRLFSLFVDRCYSFAKKIIYLLKPIRLIL